MSETVTSLTGSGWAKPELVAQNKLAPDFAADLVAALSELQNPWTDQKADVPTRAGGRFSYRYASLASILDAVRAVLAAHNIALMQSVVTQVPGTVGVITRLQHVSGASLEVGPLLMPAGSDPQQAGAAITYARRYALCAALGITADEDTDGKPKSSGESRTATPGHAESLPNRRPQAGVIAASAGKAAPASPDLSEPGFAEVPAGDVSGSDIDAGSDGPEVDLKGEGASGPSGSALDGLSHEQLLHQAMKLVGNKETKLRGYVYTFTKKRYRPENFDEVTSTELRTTIEGIEGFLATGEAK